MPNPSPLSSNCDVVSIWGGGKMRSSQASVQSVNLNDFSNSSSLNNNSKSVNSSIFNVNTSSSVENHKPALDFGNRQVVKQTNNVGNVSTATPTVCESSTTNNSSTTFVSQGVSNQIVSDVPTGEHNPALDFGVSSNTNSSINMSSPSSVPVTASTTAVPATSQITSESTSLEHNPALDFGTPQIVNEKPVFVNDDVESKRDMMGNIISNVPNQNASTAPIMTSPMDFNLSNTNNSSNMTMSTQKKEMPKLTLDDDYDDTGVDFA